ncbi:hypothetical protein WJX81_001099 [Elliptochloris bilobata]|uniref:Ubiquitin-like domain-containing protein n=1 Tax=Elliptochloris bilobata TaxID=381761 RepID=A0AAW1SCY1_9CHLO
MTALKPPPGSKYHSLVEDPATCVRETKRRLEEKEGIPVEQQRLIFYTPDSEAAAGVGGGGISPSSTEELLSSGRWEAILFRDQRAIGRLVSPSLFCSPTLNEAREGVAVVAFSLEFGQWIPAWLGRSSGSPGKPLHLPVDAAFERGDTEVSILCGSGVQEFTAVVDVVDQPAWLKRLVLRFAVLRARGGGGTPASGRAPAGPPGVDRLGAGPPVHAARGAGSGTGAARWQRISGGGGGGDSSADGGAGSSGDEGWSGGAGGSGQGGDDGDHSRRWQRAIGAGAPGKKRPARKASEDGEEAPEAAAHVNRANGDTRQVQEQLGAQTRAKGDAGSVVSAVTGGVEPVDLVERRARAWQACPAPATDLERFMAAATPLLHGRDPQQLTLGDVWADFEAASCYGREVATLGGPRGASRAYFAPSLSAAQLLLPVAAAAAPDFAGPPRRVYDVAPRPLGSPKAAAGFGGRAVPLLELFEAERPFERPVLGERVAALAVGRCAGGALPGRRLLEQPLAGLHPASWLCVAWYPIYRIPDAPLAAKFLTYHRLTPGLMLAEGGGGGGGGSAAGKLAAEQFHSDHNYFSARAPSV